MKRCECGCGLMAPIAKLTNRRWGYVKGQPVRFVVGHNQHNMKTHSNSKDGRARHSAGYVLVKQPGHPRATLHGNYVPEHVLVAEKALGHYLPLQAVVHHVNENKSENQNCNLVMCEDQSYHKLLHVRARAYKACGNPSARKCHICKTWGLDIPLRGTAHAHLICRRERDRKTGRGM